MSDTTIQPDTQSAFLDTLIKRLREKKAIPAPPPAQAVAPAIIGGTGQAQKAAQLIKHQKDILDAAIAANGG